MKVKRHGHGCLFSFLFFASFCLGFIASCSSLDINTSILSAWDMYNCDNGQIYAAYELIELAKERYPKLLETREWKAYEIEREEFYSRKNWFFLTNYEDADPEWGWDEKINIWPVVEYRRSAWALLNRIQSMDSVFWKDSIITKREYLNFVNTDTVIIKKTGIDH